LKQSKEWKSLAIVTSVFLACFYLPIGNGRFDNAFLEALQLVKWYAREHVILCLVPAFFIAGAISVFVSQASVMKYLGANAPKLLSYGVASVSGSILAVCSCTVLPLFAGIYRMGAGLGPATAFLYSGPAINVLAIILTARVLGLEMGAARAVGAILFSVIIGILMHLFFLKEERIKSKKQAQMPEAKAGRPLWQNILYFGIMVLILVFANWGKPSGEGGLWQFLYSGKWILTGLFSAALGILIMNWFKIRILYILLTASAVGVSAFLFTGNPLAPFSVGIFCLAILLRSKKGESREWLDSTWMFAKQILPLLFIGVMLSGLFLGRPGKEGLIPSVWVEKAVGGNSFRANFFASIVGALMYFATLTEIPILQGLLGSGMGKGPALALLLAGPAVSLPNMLVIRGIMGTKKTLVYIILVVCMATITGILYGALF